MRSRSLKIPTRLNWSLFATLAICSLALTLSIYPGLLQSLPVILAFLFIGVTWVLIVGGTVFFGLVEMAQRLQSSVAMDWRSQFPKTHLIRIGLIWVILMGSYGLLKFYVPRRIAFALSRPAFDRGLEKTPQGKNIRPLQFGVYKIEAYEIDRRGGQYFRAYSHGDGLGPDTVSYGFVYQPNPDGSPFGDAYYGIHPLGKRWYWFQASADW